MQPACKGMPQLCCECSLAWMWTNFTIEASIGIMKCALLLSATCMQRHATAVLWIQLGLNVNNYHNYQQISNRIDKDSKASVCSLIIAMAHNIHITTLIDQSCIGHAIHTVNATNLIFRWIFSYRLHNNIEIHRKFCVVAFFTCYADPRCTSPCISYIDWCSVFLSVVPFSIAGLQIWSLFAICRAKLLSVLYI